LNQDPADLDGDGESDAIDIAILEENKDVKQPQHRNTGCCLAFMLTSATFARAVFIISHLVT